MSNDIAKTDKVDFDVFIKTLSEDQVCIKSCKLCNSKFRKEAEDMCDKDFSHLKIFNWLESQKAEISYGAVNNHLNDHYKNQKNNIGIKSFYGRMEKWSKLTHSDEVLFNRYITMLDMNITYMAAQNENMPIAEQRKNNESLIKMVQTIAALRKQIHDNQSEMKPVEIFYESLHRIVEIKLKNINDPNTKRVLADVLTELDRAVGDVSTDGSKLINN